MPPALSHTLYSPRFVIEATSPACDSAASTCSWFRSCWVPLLVHPSHRQHTYWGQSAKGKTAYQGNEAPMYVTNDNGSTTNYNSADPGIAIGTSKIEELIKETKVAVQ